jgi:hypothetical protein
LAKEAAERDKPAEVKTINKPGKNKPEKKKALK